MRLAGQPISASPSGVAAFGLVKAVRRNGSEVYESAPATLAVRP